jgi:uncharacterized membrane protein
VPAGVDVLAVNISTLVLVVFAGLKTPVTPLGRPVTPRLTLPSKLFFDVTVRVSLPVLACLIVSAEVEPESTNEAAPDVPVRS